MNSECIDSACFDVQEIGFCAIETMFCVLIRTVCERVYIVEKMLNINQIWR